VLAGHHPALAWGLGEEHLLGAQRDYVAVHDDAGGPLRPQVPGEHGRVHGRDGGGHRGGGLAEPPAQQPEVGLGADIDELATRFAERGQVLDVELLAHLCP
jgi:hypothetical protein